MGIWDIGKDDEWVLTLALLAMIYLQDLALNKKTAHMYKKGVLQKAISAARPFCKQIKRRTAA